VKAIQITEFGGPEVMQLVDLPDPIAGPDQVLINVSAIGLNFADTVQIRNQYVTQQKLPLIPGLEVVGTTSEGKRVLASISEGAYAQKVVAHKSAAMEIPEGVSDEAALAMLVQGTTAWHILKTFGHLVPGESVVVHAGAGGVGSVAIQLAKMWGARVIAVTSSDEKSALAKSLGADVTVDAKSANLAQAMLDANNGKPVDLVLEMVGGKTFDASLEVLAPFGRVIVYGMASGEMATPVNSISLLGSNKTITGFWLGHCFGKKELLDDVIAQLFILIKNGKLKPIIGATFPLSKAGDAHRAIVGRGTTGKITLDPAL
jgi:NADPH2:quinone reductase